MGFREDMLKPETHVKMTMITLFTLIAFIVTTTAAAVAWKVNAENGIERNGATIQSEMRQNGIDHDTMRKSIDSNTEQLKAFSPALVEIQTDLKWIRAALEKK